MKMFTKLISPKPPLSSFKSYPPALVFVSHFFPIYQSASGFIARFSLAIEAE